MCDYIENIIFKHNGIIYGDYVTYKIIRKYYTDKFIVKYGSFGILENFNNKKFDIETKDRIIKISKCNINFKSFDDFIEFSNEIKLKLNTIDGGYYISSSNLRFYITIDIEEPPYGNLQLLSNGFLYYKGSNNKNIIKYSSNTGTKIDKYDEKKRCKVIKKLYNDIYNKKTQICGEISNILEIFDYMMKKDWNIINLPYSVLRPIDTNEYNLSIFNKNRDDICPICLENTFNNKDDIAFIHYKGIRSCPFKYYNLHHLCLIKYIQHQIVNIDDNLFKCPYRSNIDFNTCKDLIDYKYYYL